MTREEAIRKLQKQKAEYLEEWVDFSGVAEAYDMAIEALEQPIIRCKDCKWYGRVDKRRFYRGSDCLQKRIDTIVPERDFCSRGEIKEERNKNK